MGRRSLLAVSLSAVLLAAGGATPLSKNGILEVRVTDHREAIEDFSSLRVTISKVGIHPATAPRREGWIDLATSGESIDITKHLDGPGALLLRTGVAGGRYNGFRVEVSGSKGQLQNKEEAEVKFIESAVFLLFPVTSGKATIVTVDLYVVDMSDHPGGGYEMRVRGATHRMVDSKL